MHAFFNEPEQLTRTFVSFPIADFQQTRLQLLSWGDQFNSCCFLDNHQYEFPLHRIECMLAAGSLDQVSASGGDAFSSVRDLMQRQPGDWLFGHLGYDLKNETEGLQSSNFDGVGFPDLFFFIPEFIIQLSCTEMRIGVRDGRHKEVYDAVTSFAETLKNKHIQPNRPEIKPPSVYIQNRFSREEYIACIAEIKLHILRGNCYEINFCQEFFAEATAIDPLGVFRALSITSPNPFAAYYKLNDKYLICLSPERYLRKSGDNLISQPIKGTAQRDLNDPEQDRRNKEALASSEKERAENIMVVDLVRNDLSRVCRSGTVNVDELCVIYSFPQVFQMISTVSGQLEESTSWAAIIRATFPMGSMTGAPKKRVMELIEKFERTKRGLFSGSVGYIDPNGDFDFNVVIRSLLYNASTGYLSFHSGSAITFNSDPEKEYEECLIKAAAIKKVLAEANTFLS